MKSFKIFVMLSIAALMFLTITPSTIAQAQSSDEGTSAAMLDELDANSEIVINEKNHKKIKLTTQSGETEYIEEFFDEDKGEYSFKTTTKDGVHKIERKNGDLIATDQSTNKESILAKDINSNTSKVNLQSDEIYKVQV